MNYKTLKSMNKRDILREINGRIYDRTANFYLGYVSLETGQTISVYVPSTQKIQIVSVSDTIVKFKILDIKLWYSIDTSYEDTFKDVISSNKLYEDRLNQLKANQHREFILGAEKRLKEASKDYLHLRNFSKVELVDFVADFKL